MLRNIAFLMDLRDKYLFSLIRKDGAEKKYARIGYRIYDIPKDGVLKTQFKPNYGYQNVGEYIYVYVDSLNREIPLKMGERNDRYFEQ